MVFCVWEGSCDFCGVGVSRVGQGFCRGIGPDVDLSCVDYVLVSVIYQHGRCVYCRVLVCCLGHMVGCRGLGVCCCGRGICRRCLSVEGVRLCPKIEVGICYVCCWGG